MRDLTPDRRPDSRRAPDSAPARPLPAELPGLGLLDGLAALDFSLERWLDRLEGRR